MFAQQELLAGEETDPLVSLSVEMPTQTGYSQRLQEAMADMGIGPSELARIIGAKQQSISFLVRGRKVHGSSLTPQIASALNVGAYWLATGRGPKRPWEDAGLRGLAELLAPYQPAEIRRALVFLRQVSAIETQTNSPSGAPKGRSVPPAKRNDPAGRPRRNDEEDPKPVRRKAAQGARRAR